MNTANQVIKIERKNKAIDARIKQINYIIEQHGANKEACLCDLKALFCGNQNLKFGAGGSHIWCSNAVNDRIFIIEGY